MWDLPWELISGSFAFAAFASLVSDHLPRWLAWALAAVFAYGLIFWT